MLDLKIDNPMNYRSKRKKRPLRYYQIGGYNNPYSGYTPTLDTSISPSSGFGSGQLGTSQMMPQSSTSIGSFDTGNFDTASYFGGDSAGGGGGGGGMNMGSYGNYIAAATQAAGRLGTMDHQNSEVEDYVDVVQEGVAAAIPIAGIFHAISETGSNIARSSMGSTSPDNSAIENAEIEVQRAKAGDISGFFFQPHTLITKLATGQTESAKAEENLQRIRENMVTRTTGRSSALGGDIGGSIARGQTIGRSTDPFNLGFGATYDQVYRTGGFEKVYGPSHENGGVPKDLDEDGVIDSELEGGEIIEEMKGGGRAPKKYIWSDHLKKGGISYAKNFEEMKKKGASKKDIEKLRVEQEVAAGRDPRMLYAEYGGMMKYKAGGISIDPAKRGTFKAQATRMGMSVQEAANKILSAPEGKYSPEMRRKANFAKNFAKRDGGMMDYMEEGGVPNKYKGFSKLPEDVQKKIDSDLAMKYGYGGKMNYMEEGGKLPKDVLKSRLESHMSDAEAQDYLDSYKKGGKSKVNEAGNYTKPGMRKRMFQNIKSSNVQGTAAGKWSARKAQLLAKRYKAAGGGYKEMGGMVDMVESLKSGGMKGPQMSLKKWSDQKWRTKSGKRSTDTGERYLPSSVIESMSPGQIAAENRKKRAANKAGKGSAPYSKEVASKVRNAKKGGYMDYEDYKKGGFKSPAWTRKEGQNPSGGLNAKGRASAKAEGSNLKAPVSSGTNPRRVSFAARFAGMKGPMKNEKGEPTRKALALKKWGFGSEEAARNFANKHKKSAKYGGLMEYQLGGPGTVGYSAAVLAPNMIEYAQQLQNQNLQNIQTPMRGMYNQEITPEMIKQSQMIASGLQKATGPSASATANQKALAQQNKPKTATGAAPKSAGSGKGDAAAFARKAAPYGLIGARALAGLGTVLSMDPKERVDPIRVSEIPEPEKQFLTRVKDTGKAGREARYRSTLRSIENEVGPQKFALANQANVELTRNEEQARGRVDAANIDIDRAEKVLNTSRKDSVAARNAQIRLVNAQSRRAEDLRVLESVQNQKMAIGNVVDKSLEAAGQQLSSDEFARAITGERGTMSRFYSNPYDAFVRRYKKDNPNATDSEIRQAFISGLV